jgi:hypothetical protein
MKWYSSAWLRFLTLQLVVLSAAGAYAYSRYEQMAAKFRLPAMRNEPLKVLPLYDDARVVSDEQLSGVLYKLRPQLRRPQSQINHVDHALRFWGIEAKFDDPKCLSGEEMRNVLVDHRKFVELWGEKAPPFLIRDPYGIRVRTMEGAASASHHDHTLGGLAEVGTTLDHPVVTKQGAGTVRDMLVHALRGFGLNQIEYEWSALAFLHYLPPTRSWVTREGQEMNFDRLSERIMRQYPNQGVCMGNHRLHALVMMLRIDDEHSILSEEGRARIVSYLQQITRTLVASQHPSGYWIRTWPNGQTPVEGRPGDTENTLGNRILATGHVLEWLSLAPAEVHPPREVIVRAGQWLARSILDLDEKSVEQQYTFLTHAGRALALWRGHFPAHFLPLKTPAKEVPIAPSEGQPTPSDPAAQTPLPETTTAPSHATPSGPSDRVTAVVPPEETTEAASPPATSQETPVNQSVPTQASTADTPSIPSPAAGDAPPSPTRNPTESNSASAPAADGPNANPASSAIPAAPQPLETTPTPTTASSGNAQSFRSLRSDAKSRVNPNLSGLA